MPSACSLGSKDRHTGSMPPEQPMSSSLNFSALRLWAMSAGNGRAMRRRLHGRHGRCRRADGAGQAQRWRGQQEARALLVAQPECQVLHPPDLAQVQAELEQAVVVDGERGMLGIV